MVISRRAFAATSASVADCRLQPSRRLDKAGSAGPNVFNLLDDIPGELHRGIRERTYFGDMSSFEQAALDNLRAGRAGRGGGRLHRPAGWYPWRARVRGNVDNIVLTGDGIVLRGDCRSMSLILRTADIGKWLSFHAVHGAANVQDLEFQKFGIYIQVDTTSASLLRLTQANDFVWGSVSLLAHYCRLYLEGVTNGAMNGKCKIASDANFMAL